MPIQGIDAAGSKCSTLRMVASISIYLQYCSDASRNAIQLHEADASRPFERPLSQLTTLLFQRRILPSSAPISSRPPYQVLAHHPHRNHRISAQGMACQPKPATSQTLHHTTFSQKLNATTSHSLTIHNVTPMPRNSLLQKPLDVVRSALPRISPDSSPTQRKGAEPTRLCGEIKQIPNKKKSSPPLLCAASITPTLCFALIQPIDTQLKAIQQCVSQSMLFLRWRLVLLRRNVLIIISMRSSPMRRIREDR